nr:hypothetical protein [Bacillus licheniformis]
MMYHRLSAGIFCWIRRSAPKSAVFLLDTDLHLNCREPHALPFASEAEARKFKKGFGGQLLSFDDAALLVQKTMKNSHCGLKT